MNKMAARQTKNERGFKTTKSLGQNFLVNDHDIEKIARGAQIGERDLVIEIGPGMGALTLALADRAGKVVAIEIDRKLIPILTEKLSGRENVEIINGDVLETDLGEIIAAERSKDESIEDVKVVGNLPYYITTPIIMKILAEAGQISSITIMMQKEVAERIAAGPGTKARGALSLAVQYACIVTRISDVPREHFHPRPKVDSVVLRLDMREEKPVRVLDEGTFFACIKAGFAQRRKTLANSIAQMGLSKEEATETLEKAGIDPKRRAETLSMQEFADLANTLKAEAASGGI